MLQILGEFQKIKKEKKVDIIEVTEKVCRICLLGEKCKVWEWYKREERGWP